MQPHLNLQEAFIVVAAPPERVEAALTARPLLERWMSRAVRFEPLDGWHFEAGARWRLTLSGLGRLLEATYVVHERGPGLILWAFDGFWEGLDAWHWRPHGQGGETLVQNRIEYALRLPALDLIWPATVGPLMGWDAKTQMERLKQLCEEPWHAQSSQ